MPSAACRCFNSASVECGGVYPRPGGKAEPRSNTWTCVSTDPLGRAKPGRRGFRSGGRQSLIWLMARDLTTGFGCSEELLVVRVRVYVRYRTEVWGAQVHDCGVTRSGIESH